MHIAKPRRALWRSFTPGHGERSVRVQSDIQRCDLTYARRIYKTPASISIRSTGWVGSGPSSAYAVTCFDGHASSTLPVGVNGSGILLRERAWVILIHRLLLAIHKGCLAIHHSIDHIQNLQLKRAEYTRCCLQRVWIHRRVLPDRRDHHASSSSVAYR